VTFAARFRRSITLWIGLALAVGYWAIAPFLPTNAQTEWIRVGMAVVSAIAIISWFPAFLTIIREPSPVEAQQTILGQVLFLSGVFGGTIWLYLWRAAGFPSWMILSDINGWFLWLIALGAVFSLIAPKDLEKVPPRTRWERIWIAIGLTLVLGYILVVVRPDVRPFVEWMKVHLYDSHAGAMRTRPHA
jgi:hypothetical protein